MDEANSLDRRYSFNLAQGNPIAESTHVNGSSFSWGSISPKHRSYSSLCLNKTQTPCFNNGFSTSKTKNFPRIDARIAADIQSKGLVSRIVKYHENGTRLNRSMSAHSLYSKPGYFPAVTLKKTELPYRATKPELSMIRIPPPEKSSFYGNTISSLLRSSSVIGLQPKGNEDVSRENRPIIHPPPSEDDMAPTRSVLDVLKEISRKRINSDDLQSEETSKKYCNRGGNAVFDSGNTKVSSQPNFIASTLSCQRYKRQRDCMTHQQDLQQLETQTSPEQAKKRICNYNNDIKSSLSSSIKGKRVSKAHNLNQTMLTNLESYETQKSNNAYADMRFENLESSLRKVDTINPVSPIPPTPCTQGQNNVDGVVLKPTVSENIHNLNETNTNGLNQPVCKTRLTLFNKKCDESENPGSSSTFEQVAENTDNSNDCAGIPFVKPKKISSTNCLRNPLMERTQKSKLALMLSGLKGELYINSDVDEFDYSTNDKLTAKENIKNINADPVVSAVKSTTTITTSTTVTSSTNVEKPNSSNLLSLSTKTASTAKLLNSTNQNSSPLVGLKVSVSNSPVENISNKLCVNTTKSTEPQSKLNVPVLDGFSFCTNNSALSTNNVVEYKAHAPPTSSIPTSQNSTVNFRESTLNDKINKLPVDLHPANLSTANTCTSSYTASPLIVSKAFSFVSNANKLLSTSNVSTTVNNNVPFNIATKQNNAFKLTVPATSLRTTTTSSVPITFSTSTCSTTLTSKTNMTGIVEDNATNAVPLVVNSNNLSTSTDKTSFTTNEGITGNSIHAFSTNSKVAPHTQPASPFFSLVSNTKAKNSTLDGQPNQEVTNHTENDAFNLKTSSIFGSQCFNAKKPEIPTTSFNIFNSSVATTNFMKAEPQTFGSNTNDKSALVIAPIPFDPNNSNNSTSNLFNFGSKLHTSATSNTNVSTAPGGFSFNSAVSNSGESRTFGLNGQTNALNNTFSGVSASDSNNTFTFGLSSKKTDNTPSVFDVALNKQVEYIKPAGGFSFGSATSIKNTFSFGAGKNLSENATTIPNNPSTGFTFSTPATTKLNNISSNTSFSFGSAQTTEQKQMKPVPSSNGSSLNIFGLNDSPKISKANAFNFNTTGNGQNLQSSVNNMFAPPPSSITTGPGDRPIRRATRRLQK